MLAGERDMRDGAGDQWDDRLTDVVRLLDAAPLEDAVTFLDIGAGQGQIAKILVKMGKKVTCTGLEISSYISNNNDLREKYGIDYLECDVENLPCPDGSFDAVLMCHVLEHCPNVFMALREARRVLRKDGLLLVFVPPHDDSVQSGHISTGWNVGQLMYVLTLNGFDTRTGKFIEYGYNICAFVRRSEQVLPKLRYDRGDISSLAKAGFFPLPIGDGAGDGDYYFGRIKSINWKDHRQYKHSVNGLGIQNRGIVYFVLDILDRIFPEKIKKMSGRFLGRVSHFLLRNAMDTPDRLRPR